MLLLQTLHKCNNLRPLLVPNKISTISCINFNHIYNHDDGSLSTLMYTNHRRRFSVHQSVRFNLSKKNKFLSKLRPPSSSKVSDEVLQAVAEWKPIYRFKYIVWARTIQRLKIWQTVVTVTLLLPMSVGTALVGGGGSNLSIYVGLGISVLACSMLVAMGTFASRLVGALYVSKNPERSQDLRLSRLSFFGKRIDTILARNSFAHLCDLEGDPSDVWIKLKYIGESDKDGDGDESVLYLSLRYGSILDLKDFESVFGELKLSATDKLRDIIMKPQERNTNNSMEFSEEIKRTSSSKSQSQKASAGNEQSQDKERKK